MRPPGSAVGRLSALDPTHRPRGCLAAAGEKGLVEVIAATHTGMTLAEFRAAVTDRMAAARHPVGGRPSTGRVYRPMLDPAGQNR